jgi:HK97 family phage portal protein
MRILTREGNYETRSASPYQPWGSTAPPSPGMAAGEYSPGGIAVTEKTALQLVAVWGSVSLIADSIATLPLKQWRLAGGEPKEMEAAPVIQQPWPEITQRDFVMQGSLSMLLRGNLWGQIVARDQKLEAYPEIVKLVHPDHARITRNPTNGQIEVRYWRDDVPLENVTRAMALSIPEGLEGLSPIEYLRNTMGLARAQDLWNGAFFANSARPDGVIEVPGDYDDDEVKAALDSWLQAHQGINYAHLPAFLTGGAKWTPITMKPEEVQFLQQMQFSANSISGYIYRIPGHMLSQMEKETSWGCIPGDAMVSTTRGPVPIETVEVGTEVWAYDENGMRRATVTARAMNGYKPLLSIETHERTLRCTANHHVWVRRYFGRADGRPVGGCGHETIRVDASEVRVGDFLLVPHGHADGDGDTTPDGRPLTVGAMEFLGLYIGDGSTDKNRVEIAHEAKPDHMEHYKQVIRDEFGVEPYTDRRRTQFSSVPAIELLAGFTGTALTKRVPGWVFELRPELRLAFLRGYLDSDGSVQKGRIIYSSASRGLLEDARHLCIGLGIPAGRVCFGRAGGVGEIAGREHVSQIKWQLSLSNLPHNARIGSNSPRKASRFDGTPHSRVCRYDQGWRDGSRWEPRHRRQQPGYGWPHETVKFARVRSITASTVDVPVYDIEVKGPATFVADGVIVGNSGIEQMELGFVRNTLLIWLNRWEDLLTSWLPPKQFVTFDLSQRLRGDTLQRWSAYQIARVIGAMNNSEIRKAESLPTVTDPAQTAVLEDYAAPLNSAPVKPTSTGGAGGDKAD